MHVKNTLTEYGIISKFFHWLSAALLFVQIPLGFYLVDLDFGQERITLESIHIYLGLTIFYLIIFRLINNLFNSTPKLNPPLFKGQKLIAKLNHRLLYLTVLAITVSGIFKKLLNGESLVIFFREIKVNDNYILAEQFYDIHIIANYILIILIILHISAVIVHKLFFDENLLKKIL